MAANPPLFGVTSMLAFGALANNARLAKESDRPVAEILGGLLALTGDTARGQLPFSSQHLHFEHRN